MTKRRTILHKKLQELETELNQIFTLPPESTLPCHNLISESIEQRFLFLNNLLSAEIASRDPEQQQQHHHLEHISRSLSLLESKFHQWDNHKPPADGPFLDNVGFDDDDHSTECSCTESVRNEFDDCFDGGDIDQFEDAETVVVETRRAESEEGISERSGVGGGGYMVSVGMAALWLMMGFVMGSFYCCIDFEGNHEFALTPT